MEGTGTLLGANGETDFARDFLKLLEFFQVDTPS
jgi:hypothetical protein